ncbi:conserved hypothetical protein [Tenacibaculum sp. 190524A02b]|uniref:Peptidase M1 membrane alanine aminopeptidase domain-containing protein n=1 Tax=Tenacibaculum vairaonense TaxID=3137860 RepID=A0ABM9PHY5_9FLAO
MNQTFTNLFSLTVFLIIISSSKLWAQKPDHLSMDMHFKDSTVFIKAKYQRTSKLNNDSVYFILNPEFELDTILSKGLTSYKITQKKGEPLPFYLLEFDKNRDTSEKLTVEFRYKINLSKQNHMKSNWIELSLDKLWFPNLEALNNKFTYKVSISNFPKSYHLITHTDAFITQKQHTITIKKNKPSYEVLILAGKDMKEWKQIKNITLLGHTKIPDSTFQSIGTKVKNSIDLLNGYFGMSDPITSFKVVIRNTSRKELGFMFNRNNMIVTGTDYNDYESLSHEIAHYWWNKANFIKEPWMNESFANYSMYQVLKKFNIEKYEALLTKNRELSKNAIPVVNAHLFASGSYMSIYHKGSIHLIELETKIGTKLMQQLLSICVEKRLKTTEDFLKELEKLTNKETRKFFENLLQS